MEALALQKDFILSENLAANGTLRIFSAPEMQKLDIECRGFLLFLEQSAVIDSHDREVVIDRAMALEAEEIDMQQLKWVVLMVLLNQPGKEAAFTWMEDIVMDDTHSGLH